MSVLISCTQCGAHLKAPDQAAGHTLPCPKCGTSITVPPAAESAGQPPAEAAAPPEELTLDARPASETAAQPAETAPDKPGAAQREHPAAMPEECAFDAEVLTEPGLSQFITVQTGIGAAVALVLILLGLYVINRRGQTVDQPAAPPAAPTVAVDDQAPSTAQSPPTVTQPAASPAPREAASQAAPAQGPRTVRQVERIAPSGTDPLLFAGSGVKETQPFSVKSSPWRVEWQSGAAAAGPSVFQVFLYDQQGQLVSIVANAMGAAQGTAAIQAPPSRYYLSITAGQVDWRITVYP